ncbi:uncharacterized protein A1O9_12706 [Exophiala aquamarina CBS 119918]|uniref:Major facilitator superfamily (MFS) profile domain-containing protein n=1 Tax=Exophiala aquamarina CBS 119918 TaxID=1182545 RepID=A0A072NW00_9EURO|nr:uncharacterized protein A1O9_12706 [Exophiala aquamarina CBS 119918]KEF51203.1 hypothetical protein A1O9_12706 [Exophiala aquamarina CBS 119918]
MTTKSPAASGQVEAIEYVAGEDTKDSYAIKHHLEFDAPLVHVQTLNEAEHVRLGWRTWAAVFFSSFAVMTQTHVVIAAGSVIAFIMRELGTMNAAWIIQGPLLIQSALAPTIGRLSDVLDRRYLASLPPLIAFAGAVISARATSMNMLIGGGILIGVTLSTVSIVHAIPSEVLPLKYRVIANGLGYLGGSVAGIVGVLGSGALTNASPTGWRNIFWMQAAFHLVTFLGLIAFYHPIRKSDYPKSSWKQVIWACDPWGSLFFVFGCTLLLLAMDWASGAYEWSDAQVAAPLALGFVCLIAFGVYEWIGRSDGLISHVFFRGSANFAISMFCFTVEGWLFYSAVNSVTPRIILNLGFERNAWNVAIRQLSLTIAGLVTPFPLMWYSTKYKDIKSPLIFTYVVFLAVAICYSLISPSMSHAQIAFQVLAGIGVSGPLCLLVTLIQFTAPHAYLSTATGLAYSARAIGGAFGAAVLDTIINDKLKSYPEKVGNAATEAGLPTSSVATLLKALAAGTPVSKVPGMTPSIQDSALHASRWAYTRAYRPAWASIIPFVVLAIVATFFLKSVRELMTERIEATVERVPVRNEDEKA